MPLVTEALEDELKALQERILEKYDESLDFNNRPNAFWQGARAVIDFILGEDQDPTE